ncbi:amidohydrolase family protein [Paraburkholderia phenazinium]|uniref:Cytosine/adenosine deaminase n=1 Tax=Paraburkholderia phenazinium TaxID=60549 RepID=A0A1N6J0P0_9BURK|nr:amidohydrolase family protein [Paraburkholderia phenazinium]SIO37880.1 Cytosine/adenosine deaminase [Paraburkholderia phenazinium]
MTAGVDTQVLRVGRLLTAPGRHAPSGPSAIHVRDGRVAAIEALPHDATDRSRSLIALPAPVNAHDHGRGLRTLAFGAADGPLETWIAALAREPRVDPYLRAAVAFAGLAEGGICAANHCHNTQNSQALYEEAVGVAKAAYDVGIRVAFAVPFAGANPTVYGNLGALLARLPEDDRAVLLATQRPSRTLADNLALTERIAALQHPWFSVQYGPVGPQWVDHATLEAVARASAETGRRVHMHLFETRQQREWADARYGPGGLIAYLAGIGMLSARLTVAHGVWLTPDECDVLARYNVTVSINTSSNLRLQSGIAPLASMIERGVRFGIGLDGMALDDDDDMLREMRLLRHVQQTQSHATLSIGELFDAACRHGRSTVVSDGGGSIEVGAPADILIVDTTRIFRDRLNDSDEGLLDLLLARLTKADIATLVVAGRTIVERGQCCSVSRSALEQALLNDARRAREIAPLQPADTARLTRLHTALGDFYACGCHRKPD